MGNEIMLGVTFDEIAEKATMRHYEQNDAT